MCPSRRSPYFIQQLYRCDTLRKEYDALQSIDFPLIYTLLIIIMLEVGRSDCKNYCTAEAKSEVCAFNLQAKK